MNDKNGSFRADYYLDQIYVLFHFIFIKIMYELRMTASFMLQQPEAILCLQ